MDMAPERDTSSKEEPIATGELRREGADMFYQPKFKYIFCDMDGTLLDSGSQVTEMNAEAIRVAMSRGVKTVIATGKSRHAVIEVLGKVNLTGTTGVVSESSLGVFLQGLLVYGEGGQKIYQKNLDIEVCREVLLYSLENKIALVAFSQDDCYTLFDNPLVDNFHDMYHEPKVSEKLKGQRLYSWNPEKLG